MRCVALQNIVKKQTELTKFTNRILAINKVLQNSETLKWFQETEEKEFELTTDFWFDTPVLRILQNIETDKLCLFAGELEFELDADCHTELNINSKEVTYKFYREDDYSCLLKISLAAPKCRIVIDEEIQRSSTNNWTERKGHMVCD